MNGRWEDFTVCSAVGTKLIGHQLPRSLPLMFQCLTKEALGGSTVSVLSDQNIDDISILIYCPPQVVAYSLNRNEHFIDTPDVPKPTLFPAQRSSIDRSKLDAPGSDRLVRDGDSSLREQVLDIAKAECEPMIEPNGMADDFRWEPMTSIS
jgi:hypothetical protein